nr:hypothetical protein BaRGS_020030 [Batillaria attramentaria]
MGQTKDVLHKATEKETLAVESREYGDVVQWEGLLEDYSNLTLKVLLGLRWGLNTWDYRPSSMTVVVLFLKPAILGMGRGWRRYELLSCEIKR